MKRLILALCLCVPLAGCAVGKGPTGEIVIGVEAGRMAETTEHVIGGALNSWLPGMGTLVAGGLTSVGGVGAITAAVRNARKRKRADQAREQAEKDAIMAEADAKVAVAEAKVPVAVDGS
jgi:hypothetical protein